jgi:ABC-2 type transport system permease protein
MLRRRRLIPMTAITLLPVMIPLAMSFFAASPWAADGSEIFTRLAESVHINLFCPLLALFFASLLIGDDIESQTITYALTRPMPRSALVLGRFCAYTLLAASILIASAVLTFAAAASLGRLAFDRAGLIVLAQYLGVMIAAIIAYGAAALFLGAATRRPVLFGVLLFYAWQKIALLVPGLVDFFTIQKYTGALLPALAAQRMHAEIQTSLGTWHREVFLVSAGKAALALAAITAVFLLLTVILLRAKEFTSARSLAG